MTPSPVPSRTFIPFPAGARSIVLCGSPPSPLLPPCLSSLRFDPALPAGISARLKIDGVSVPMEDMLAVPDWAEARSETARAIRDLTEELFVDIRRYSRASIELSEPLPVESQVVAQGFGLGAPSLEGSPSEAKDSEEDS
jgi:hypothetical protein